MPNLYSDIFFVHITHHKPYIIKTQRTNQFGHYLDHWLTCLVGIEGIEGNENVTMRCAVEGAAEGALR